MYFYINDIKNKCLETSFIIHACKYVKDRWQPCQVHWEPEGTWVNKTEIQVTEINLHIRCALNYKYLNVIPHAPYAHSICF